MSSEIWGMIKGKNLYYEVEVASERDYLGCNLTGLQTRASPSEHQNFQRQWLRAPPRKGRRHETPGKKAGFMSRSRHSGGWQGELRK